MTHKYDLTEVLCCCILFPCFVFFVEFFLYMNKILPFQKNLRYVNILYNYQIIKDNKDLKKKLLVRVQRTAISSYELSS